MDPHLLEIIRKIAQRHQQPHGTHGFEHTQRVYDLCKKLGEQAGADLSILLPAALLHDIGRGEEDHASAGARKARNILAEIGFDEGKTDAVTWAIESHSFSAWRTPASLEAKILSDADKLDAMGALGVYRAGMYSGEHVRPIDEFIGHFHEKLLTLKDLLFTEEAKRLAESRHQYMLDYLRQLERELRAEG